MGLTRADLVWNRAALEVPSPDALEGDCALAALLLVHGMVCNGGVEHAFESLSASEVSAGQAGYRFFGLDDVARVFDCGPTASAEEFDAADRRYWQLVPDDGCLVEAFEAVYTLLPDLFASVAGG